MPTVIPYPACKESPPNCRAQTNSPDASSLAIYMSLFDAALAKYSANRDLATKMATQPLGPPPDGMDVAELAAWTIVGSTLLNLDEMFLKR